MNASSATIHTATPLVAFARLQFGNAPTHQHQPYTKCVRIWRRAQSPAGWAGTYMLLTFAKYVYDLVFLGLAIFFPSPKLMTTHPTCDTSLMFRHTFPHHPSRSKDASVCMCPPNENIIKWCLFRYIQKLCIVWSWPLKIRAWFAHQIYCHWIFSLQLLSCWVAPVYICFQVRNRRHSTPHSPHLDFEGAPDLIIHIYRHHSLVRANI